MQVKLIDKATAKKIAVLYQALPPPMIDGVRKAPKPGGYADSGADIAFCLRQAGFELVTPCEHPDPANALEWLFPDTEQGLRAALDAGANVLWANTVLFTGHPIERYLGTVWIVGQRPACQEAVDDKFATNLLLRAKGLPVAASILVASLGSPHAFALAQLSPSFLVENGLGFPLVVKPVRGRGSQGVSRVNDQQELVRAVESLLASGQYGERVIVEQYLAGEELTITVMPGHPRATGDSACVQALPLPPVRRFNHADGIAPYNGTVAVTANSAALPADACTLPTIRSIMDACAHAFPLLGALAPIRIDCRGDADGNFRIFDVNMKPNMTGAGRPGRDDQDNLCLIAARSLGWSYADLLTRMLDSAWMIAPEN